MTNALKNIQTLLPLILPTDPARKAWAVIADRHDFHPAVLNVLEKHEPVDWVALMWQYPYVAVRDPTRLAFSQSKAHLIANRQTLITIPRYLTRHFPQLKDHEIRDLATYTDGCTYKLLDDIHEIIFTVDTAKIWSCMQSSNGGHWVSSHQHEAYKAQGVKFYKERHPYAAYCPSLGWRLAVRYSKDGEIMARALVFDGVFVRSYQADGPRNNKADPQLEAWMESQGFTEECEWETGTPLKRRDPMVFPYIDGDNQYVDDDFCIASRGYRCNSTDGTADGYSHETCGDCGGPMQEDESYYIEAREHNVCECCIDDYTFIESAGEYIDNRYVERVGGTYFDTRNVPDGIVELEEGGYADIDDCVSIDDEWYRTDDYNVVVLEEEHDGDSCGLRNDCWQTDDGRWFHDDVESVEIGGKAYLLSECEEDEITGKTYAPGTEMLDLPCGKTVHPDSFAAKQLELKV